MNRLAFDTATAACMVALERVDGEVFETAPAPGRMFEQPAHTTELLPAIDGLLAQAGVGYAELGAVIVGTGPGAFTGLRIGVATARAIATARALPLIPVSSLAALIAGADAGDRPVFAVIDAKRREFFF
ncbi:MAG: tRNA (adenosine(37)-N6)-threonylcarbamoyltransferase complex dimerization subunit type 1 TsaB, partial [Solirubrobacterales bacterium]